MRAMKAALLTVFNLLYQVVFTSRSTVCNSHMGACVSSHFCQNEQGFFTHICDFKDGSCQLTDPKVCNSTLQMILTRSPTLGECLCYATDPCSTIQQIYSQCQRNLAQDNKESEAELQAGDQIGYVRHTNCLEAIMACIEEEVCNRKMVPFVQSCSAQQCNPHQCSQALGQFYSTLPHNIAETLAFCDCDRDDQECQQMKDSLHTVSCETDESQTPWTCLEMMDSCSRDALCRQKFNGYLSDCFGAEEAPHDERSTNIWLQLLDPDFFLGEQQQCRVAFVATMGSILHHPCICDGLHYNDQHKCIQLQQIFHNKSLFKLLWTKQNFREKILDESDESSVEKQAANESSSEQQPTKDLSAGVLSDQLIYLIIYISVLMVVVLFAVSLVLQRLRRLHKAAGKQQSFQPHQSKSLMLVSDNNNI